MENEMKLAHIDNRFFSYFLDQILIMSVLIVLVIISEKLIPIFFVFPPLYYIYFFSKGQTLGMRFFKIRLRTKEGEYKIGIWRGIARLIGMHISSMFLYLGWIWMLVDKNKQGWHDKLAGVYVVEGGKLVNHSLISWRV